MEMIFLYLLSTVGSIMLTIAIVFFLLLIFDIDFAGGENEAV